MKRKLQPLNISLLTVTPADKLLMKPITTISYYEGSSGQFSDEGLFSTKIFGRLGEKKRSYEFAYIPLNLTILHPVIFKNLVRLKRLYKEILEGSSYAIFNQEVGDFEKASNVEEGAGTGYHFFISHFNKLTPPRNKSIIRSGLLDIIDKYRNEAEQSAVLVLPAGLRDVYTDTDGRIKMDDVNKLYQRLIALNASLPGNPKEIGDPTIYDQVRLGLQNVFNEIYAYFTAIMDGKTGLLQARLASRRIYDGIRGVITSLNVSAPDLKAPNTPGFLDTVIGLFQTARGMMPKTCYFLSQGILRDVFEGASTTVGLVNTKTLKKEAVTVTAADLDRWYSDDGFERLVTGLEETGRRHRPVIVRDHYLALVFNNGKYFRIFRDIDELPEEYRDKASEFVHPITYIELVYFSGFTEWNKHHCIVTRYPVAGMGSTVPSGLYVKTTDVGCMVTELDDDWTPIEGRVALEAPLFNKTDPSKTQYHDSISIPPCFLKGASAD